MEKSPWLPSSSQQRSMVDLNRVFLAYLYFAVACFFAGEWQVFSNSHRSRGTWWFITGAALLMSRAELLPTFKLQERMKIILWAPARSRHRGLLADARSARSLRQVRALGSGPAAGTWTSSFRAGASQPRSNLKPGFRFPCFLTGVLFRWNPAPLLMEDLHCHKPWFFPDVLPNKSGRLIRGFESKSCYHDFKGTGWNWKKQRRHFLPLSRHWSWIYILVLVFVSCGYQNSTMIK